MVESAIQNILTDNPPINLADSSVFMGVNPNAGDGNPNTKKWIVHFRDTTEPHYTKSGRSTLDTVSYQINMFAYDAVTVRNMATACRDLLDRKKGTYGPYDVFIQSIQFTNQVALFEFNDTYNMRGVYQITQYYDIRVQPIYS